MIIVEYLGDVLFCDPGWVSPSCRRHPQFMPAQIFALSKAEVKDVVPASCLL